MRTSLIALAAALAPIAIANASAQTTPAQPETTAPNAEGNAGVRAGAKADTTDILVLGKLQADTITLAPSTRASIDATTINTTVNAASVEDTLKYFPSLVIRKRSIGDNYAPVGTRTSGLGMSARSLIFADGALLSAFIGNNNGNGSPRWTLVTPEEIQSIDVLYGPFSAAYAGNSIGTTINITTRLPDKLEARVTALTNVQTFSYYGTSKTLPSEQISASIGDRFGPLALFASVTRTEAQTQPISFATITGTTQPTGTTGGYADLNKTGAAIRVLGASGLEHHIQNTFKIKSALDLTSDLRATYVLGIWTDNTDSTLDSYEQGPGGTVSYATANNGVTTGFNSGLYTRDALHFSHALTLQQSGHALDWQVTGTIYHYAHDLQQGPSTATTAPTNPTQPGVNSLPAAFTGGPGTVQRLDGTGWVTLDAKAAWHTPADSQTISFGAHGDRYTLNSVTYAATDWLDANTQGAPTSISRGQTRTLAIWAQDAVKITPRLTLTLGARQEWWRAWNGYNYTASTTSTTPLLNQTQPGESAHGFSPKASLEWRFQPTWSLKGSFGQAYRFATVSELYQAVTTGTTQTSPNPNLSPERARSGELALEKRDSQGFYRLSLFDEVIDNALISQSAPLVPGSSTLYSYVQNVDRTRARGVELAFARDNLLRGVDLSGSVTYADAITSKDTAFPTAQGKLLPSVPRWKANMVATWHITPRVALTGAGRYSSRNYANLDDSDTVGNTYTGFYQYLVFDARVTWQVTDRIELGAGVDNVNNDKYFLYHPFPQRSYTAQLNWKL
jgi:iron complex outermembrane recepter protein